MSKLNVILRRVLNIPEDKLRNETGPGDIENWDSLGHLHLVHALEEEFGIEFDMQQIEYMQTIEKIRNTLNKAGVENF